MKNWKQSSMVSKLYDGAEEIEGRQYLQFFAKKEHSYYHLYHVPTGTSINIYKNRTLDDMTIIVNQLIKLEIDWDETENSYYQNLSKEIKSKAHNIIFNYPNNLIRKSA